MSMPPCFLITLTFILNTVYIYSQISPTTVNSSGTFYIASATTGQRFTGAIICSGSYCHIVCDAAKACYGLKVDVISASTALVVQCRDYEDSCRNAVITVNTAYSVDLLCEYTNIYSSKAPCLGLDLHARNVQNGVRIVCNGDYVCRYANVSASNVGDSLTMICRGTGTCWSVDVYCLKDVQCNVTANHMRPNLITNDPTGAPSAPSSNPTSGPSQLPTISTPAPTRQPSDDPTMHPSQRPTVNPSAATEEPTDEPTNEPTDEPSDEPQEADEYNDLDGDKIGKKIERELEDDYGEDIDVYVEEADESEDDSQETEKESLLYSMLILTLSIIFVVLLLYAVFHCFKKRKKEQTNKHQTMIQAEMQQNTSVIYNTSAAVKPDDDVIDTEIITQQMGGTDIEQWLDSFGLAKYHEILYLNGYDSMDFVKAIANQEDLREIGIDSDDDINKIMSEIAKLSQITHNVTTEGNDSDGMQPVCDMETEGNDEIQEKIEDDEFVIEDDGETSVITPDDKRTIEGNDDMFVKEQDKAQEESAEPDFNGPLHIITTRKDTHDGK